MSNSTNLVQGGHADQEDSYRADLPAGGPILAAALQYHQRGWSIIPIAAGTKKPPKGFQWKQYQSKRPTERELYDWFADRDDRGLAVIFGKVSGGLVCRDFDVLAGYDRWAADHPELARALPTVATARGRHVYFCSNHRGIKKLTDGELRGAGYCLLPPSRHPAGTTYRWLNPLAEGPLPIIDDILGEDLLGHSTPYVTENTQTTEMAEITETTETTEENKRKLSAIDELIRDTLPSGVGRRNRQVFDLARALKANLALVDAPVDKLEPYVRRWHFLGRQRQVIGTEAFEETWIDFLTAWPKVKFPKGSEPMTRLFESAKHAPLPKSALQYEQTDLRLLVALCRELQQVSGDKPFFLACRTAADLLGLKTARGETDHVKTWRWLYLLIHDKVIAEIEKGDRARRRASRYRYLGD